MWLAHQNNEASQKRACIAENRKAVELSLHSWWSLGKKLCHSGKSKIQLLALQGKWKKNLLSYPVLHTNCFTIWIARIACWLERQTGDWKVVSSNPGRSGGWIFFSKVNFVCSYSVFIPPRTTTLVHKRPRSFRQKYRWQDTPKHAYTFDKRSWSGLTMPLSRQSVGTDHETSSHATCRGTLGYSHLSSLSRCGLILAERVVFVCVS